MDKVLLELGGIKTDDTVEVSVLGEKVRVRRALTRAEKQEAAIEMMAMGVYFDDEFGVCHEMPNRDVTDFWVIVKHYTDIDAEPYEDVEDQMRLYDALAQCGAMDEILSICGKDCALLWAIAARMADLHIQRFEHQHSLSFQIKAALSGLLTADGQEKTVREAREVNEFLINALNMAAKLGTGATDKPTVVSNGMLTFAKRELNELRREFEDIAP